MQPVKIIGTLLLGMIPTAADAAVLAVNDAAASGIGSLKVVITAANASPGTGTIAFAIAGTGVKTLVAPRAGRRQITESLNANGSTQSGSAMNAIVSDASNARIHIEFDAAAVTLPSGRVFSVDSGAVTFGGIALTNPPTGTIGVRPLGSAGAPAIHGCFLGTHAAGDVDSPPACGAFR